MDISRLSTAMATTSVKNDVGVAVLSKTISEEEQLGQGVVDMIDKANMERSVNPFVGGNIDAFV